jgi:hypothetical protein
MTLGIHFGATPEEALSRLLADEPLHQQHAPGVNPVHTLRAAVRVIWGEVDALEGADQRRVLATQELLARYSSDRGRLLGAAIRHSTGLGLNFGEVGALLAAYDAGLDLLRKAAPE